MPDASRPVTSSTPDSARMTVTSGPASRSASCEACGDRTCTRERVPPAMTSATGASVMMRPLPSTMRWSAVMRHLAHQVRRQEDGATFGGEVPHELAHPEHALGVEAVDGLVEEQRRRVAEHRRGDAEPLAHAEREAADPLARDRLEAGELDDLAHALLAEAVRGGHREEVVLGGAAGVHGLRVEQRADLAERGTVLRVRLAVDRDTALARAVEADDHAHGGRLAGAVRAEEAGDLAGAHGERDVVDGGLRAEALGESFCSDHDIEVTDAATRAHRPCGTVSGRRAVVPGYHAPASPEGTSVLGATRPARRAPAR